MVNNMTRLVGYITHSLWSPWYGKFLLLYMILTRFCLRKVSGRSKYFLLPGEVNFDVAAHAFDIRIRIWIELIMGFLKIEVTHANEAAAATDAVNYRFSPLALISKQRFGWTVRLIRPGLVKKRKYKNQKSHNSFQNWSSYLAFPFVQISTHF